MSRFGPETHDFGHAMIAPVDQRLASDTFNRSSGASSLRFASHRLAQQRLKNGARHRLLSPRGPFAGLVSKTVLGQWLGSAVGRKTRQRRRKAASIFAQSARKLSVSLVVDSSPDRGLSELCRMN